MDGPDRDAARSKRMHLLTVQSAPTPAIPSARLNSLFRGTRRSSMTSLTAQNTDFSRDILPLRATVDKRARYER